MTPLAKLKSLLIEKGYDGYLVPRADAFFGEEVRACDERLAYLTGFQGSAGLAIALAKGKGHLLVDGRYDIQAEQQVDLDDWQVSLRSPSDLKSELDGLRLAYDPWLFSETALKVFADTDLVAEHSNLIDQVWGDRPAPVANPSYDLADELTGESSQNKRARMLSATENRAILITQTDALAWLTNWRGTDLQTTPVYLAFGILHPDSTVTTYRAEQRDELLAALSGGEFAFDPGTTCVALKQALGARGFPQKCPLQLAKSIKNAAEVTASRTAHQIDRVAVEKFLRWFDQQVAAHAPLTELDLVAKLAEFRAESPEYKGPSFETISGSGPNGAIAHYRVDQDSNRTLQDGDFIVLDSGGQYPGATTDITRTLAYGAVSERMRRDYTLVLKGMISLTIQKFPEGTTGHQLDVLARAALWNAGLNYGHGTGHGVGAGLSVHESPPNVSPRATLPKDEWALKPGMIFSNEPGFYISGEGGYGIRIENLLVVVEVGEVEGAGSPAPKLLGFETLTNAPIDMKLVQKELLNAGELEWLETYQAQF